MLSPKKLFEKFDKNKDGMLSLDEFCDAVFAFSRNLSQEDIEKRFKEIDVNGDGEINANEFVSWIERMLKRSFALCDADGDGKITAKELYVVMTRIGKACTEESCAEKVRAADIDNDGYLSFEEFKAKFKAMYFTDF